MKPTNKVARAAAEQSAAEPAAAELVEPRAEAEGNAGWQSTHRTQCRVSVSQALDRIRQAIAVVTRGGNRMRESCKYGSVWGAPSNGLYRDRREFISLLGSGAAAAVASPIAAPAQQAGKVWRIGVLETISPELNVANFDALRKGLRSFGYIEGRNLIIEYRSADGEVERFPELATELVHAKVDVIVTRGTPAVVAAKNATTTIPVVMSASGEPLVSGVIARLARPGGNVTGLSAFTNELIPKRIELLNGAVSGLARIAFLQNMSNPVAPSQWEELKTAAQSVRIEPLLLDARSSEDVARAFEAAGMQGIGALVVGNDTVTHANRRQIVKLAARHRLPTIYATREFVDAGGLMTYGVSYSDLYRRAATYVDKIFKGAKPADLPVEQPSKFDLVINLRTAKALGLEISTKLLAIADEVIE